MLSFVSGSVQWCLHAGWWDEVETIASHAQTWLPYRVCMGYCQQFLNYSGWNDGKASCDQKDGASWRTVTVSFGYIGTNAFQ